MARFSFRFIDDDWGGNEPDTEIIHKFNATKDVASLVKHFENFLKSSGVELNGTINYVPEVTFTNIPELDEIKIDLDQQYLYDNMMASNPFKDDGQITIKSTNEEPLHFRV